MSRARRNLTSHETGRFSRNSCEPGKSLIKEHALARLLLGRTMLAGALYFFVVVSNQQFSVAGPSQTDYTLGVLDRVRIRVFEWRAARDEVHEWAALNSEYAVGPTGRISMPLIGEIAATGITSGDLAKAVGLRLKTRMGLAEAPDIAVEITQFRPFYIAGSIEKPGEYSYRPGMTVIQALSLSGGLTRTGERGSLRLEREVIQTSGDLSLVSQEFNALLARRARLEAEASSVAKIIFPPALRQHAEANASLSLLLEQEQEVFRTRRETFNSQVETLGQLLTLFDEEIKALNAQMAVHEKQIKSLQDELSDISTLVAKGISTKPRRTALERHITQMDSERIRLQTALMRAKQDRSRTVISMHELHNKRQNDATSELRDSQLRLEALAHRSQTLERMLTETQFHSSTILTSSSNEDAKNRPIFRISRVKSGVASDIIATETTTIEPGDTVKVEIPAPALLNLPNLLVGPSRQPLVQIPAAQPEPVQIRPEASRSGAKLVPSASKIQ